jgi:hypothetical protein
VPDDFGVAQTYREPGDSPMSERVPTANGRVSRRFMDGRALLDGPPIRWLI